MYFTKQKLGFTLLNNIDCNYFPPLSAQGVTFTY